MQFGQNFTARERLSLSGRMRRRKSIIRKKSCGNLSLGESSESIYVYPRAACIYDEMRATQCRDAVRAFRFDAPSHLCVRFSFFVTRRASSSVCSSSEKRRTATQNPYATTRAVVYITAVPIPTGIVSLNFGLLCYAAREHCRSLSFYHIITDKCADTCLINQNTNITKYNYAIIAIMQIILQSYLK